jgi:putative ABC transport system permease protein
MKELFGIPMQSIMIVLVVIFAVSMLSMAYIYFSNKVMFKMGLRNLPRRGLQTGLVVLGLMLATLIITASFTTGDTVDHSIKGEAYRQLQRSDLNLKFRGEDSVDAEGATPAYVPDGAVPALEEEFAGDPDIEGFLPFLVEPVAAVNQRTRLSEPTINVTGIDPERLARLGGLRLTSGGRFDLSTLTEDQILLNESAAEDLDAKTGDTIVLFANGRRYQADVAGIVEDEIASGGAGGFSDTGGVGGGAMLMSVAQRFTGHRDQVNVVTAALKGGVRDSYTRSDAAAPRLESYLRSDEGKALLALDSDVEVETIKLDAVNDAEDTGNLFVTFFLILGMFSIASGILLIFMIFVMMAAERKPEMGMARAVGAQRSNLVQSFLSEGMAYNLIAGAVGAALGVAAALALVVGFLKWTMGDDLGFIAGKVTLQSIVISYCLGVVITFITVVIASINVSSVNIVAAIRGTSEDETPEPRSKVSWLWVAIGIPAMIIPPLGIWFFFRKGLGLPWPWILAPIGMVLGVLAIMAANGSGSEFLFSFGFCIIPLSAALLASHYRAPPRTTWTIVGLILAAYWMAPVNVGEELLGREMKGDIEMFVVSGIMTVVAFTLIIVFNARLLTLLFQRNGHWKYRTPAILGAATLAAAAAGVALGDAGDGVGQLAYLLAILLALAGGCAYASVRFPGIAPALKMGVAYPLSNRFRTGMTIAMFSLIIFSLTVFSAVNANFIAVISGETAKDGWDVVATENRTNDVPDLVAALESAGAPESQQVAEAGRVTLATGEQQIRQDGAADFKSYPVLAADDAFFGNSQAGLDSRANGYASDREVLDAVRTQPNLALLDWNSIQDDQDSDYDWVPDVEVKDGKFEPFQVEFRNLATDETGTATIIGVLATKLESTYVAGLYVNEATYEPVYGEANYQRTYLRLVSGTDAVESAKGIESALSTAGVQAESIDKLIDDSAAMDRAFTRLFQAFMALGLFVGVAALGVIAFRSVVERRQQIGMLRAIGYQSNSVALTFVLESTFVAMMGILSGVVGGVVVSRNLFTIGQFSGEGVDFSMPWGEVAVFVMAAFVVSLFMTWWPSRSAASVPVAEALRYE